MNNHQLEEMKKMKKTKDTRTILRVVIPSALLILIASLEVLMIVKDFDFFKSWQNIHGEVDFSTFLNTQIFLYLSKILYPILLSLYTFATLDKLGITRSYELVWGFLGIASILIRVLEFRFNSLFYYLSLVIYVILILNIFTLSRFASASELTKP